MRKSILPLAIAAALAIPSVAGAQQAAPAAAAPSPHTLTGNAGFFSQYIFRGATQTDGKPALQGGFDYGHSSGLYAGTWASNISLLGDAGAYTSSSLEWDFYGGYKGAITGDFGYDVGLLYYYYPGRAAPGVTKADTLEAYGALTWKWLSAKLSYSLGDTFGVKNSSGTYYLDFTATYPLSDKLNLVGHYGIQKYDGSNFGVSNDDFASYKDWKLGLTYTLPKDFTVGAYYTDTSMIATQTTFYTNPAGRFLGKDTVTVYLQKAF